MGGAAPSAHDSSRRLQIGLDTGYWTAINHFFIWGSVAVYFAILFAMHSKGLFDMFPNQFRFVGESLRLPQEALGCHDCYGTHRVGSRSALREHLFHVPQAPGVLGGWLGVSAPGAALGGLPRPGE